MPKFDIVKRYPLNSFGPGWEECYIEFTAITVKEITSGEISGLAKMDVSDPKAVMDGYRQVFAILKEHFISGKAKVNNELVDLKFEDLEDFPAEVLGGILGFLLAKSTEPEKSPSSMQ